jgi:hypothetical protein
VSARQQVLFLWLASSSLDATVLGWAFHDGTAGAGPQPDGDPPYASGVAALVDGWRLLQVSPLVPAAPGHERETSFLKHEFVFERIVEVT